MHELPNAVSITAQSLLYHRRGTAFADYVRVVAGHELIPPEPARWRNQQDTHGSGARVFDSWGDLDDLARRNMVLLVGDRECSGSFDDVVYSSKSLADHECI